MIGICYQNAYLCRLPRTVSDSVTGKGAVSAIDVPGPTSRDTGLLWLHAVEEEVDVLSWQLGDEAVGFKGNYVLVAVQADAGDLSVIFWRGEVMDGKGQEKGASFFHQHILSCQRSLQSAADHLYAGVCNTSDSTILPAILLPVAQRELIKVQPGYETGIIAETDLDGLVEAVVALQTVIKICIQLKGAIAKTRLPKAAG